MTNAVKLHEIRLLQVGRVFAFAKSMNAVAKQPA